MTILQSVQLERSLHANHCLNFFYAKHTKTCGSSTLAAPTFHFPVGLPSLSYHDPVDLVPSWSCRCHAPDSHSESFYPVWRKNASLADCSNLKPAPSCSYLGQALVVPDLGPSLQLFLEDRLLSQLRLVLGLLHLLPQPRSIHAPAG